MERDKEKKECKKIEEIASLSGKDVLEIGCGDGKITAFLVNKARNLTAIDPDEKALEKARKKGHQFFH